MNLTVAVLALTLTPGFEDVKTHKLEKTIAVKGDGVSWDYVVSDDAGRSVYVTHGTEVVVLDSDSLEVKGKIDELKGVHGVAIAPELGRGFISDGRANSVVIFDLKTLKKIGSTETGRNPDAIIYDPTTKRVFAFNGSGASVTAIDAKDGKVAGTIALGGKPEYAVADGKGNVFVNIEDKSLLAKIDANKLTVLDRFPIAPGATPSSLAIDAKNGRVFVGCRNQNLVVINADNGKVVANWPIGARVDASVYDPETHLVFSSQGDGTVTVVKQEDADKYTVVETIKTRAGAKTMGLDAKTHRLFIPVVDTKADPANPTARPRPVAGSFAVEVYGK